MIDIHISPLDLIKHFEGCELTTYVDEAGVRTIGWGCTGSIPGIGPIVDGMTITQEQADTEFQRRVNQVGVELMHVLDGVPILPNVWAALLSLVYNIGIANFETSSVLRCLKGNDFGGAAKHFLDWDKVHIDGKLTVSADLLARRLQEQKVFLGT
jgi:lysozyme